MSRRYRQGSTPNAWQVCVRVYSNTAFQPPTSPPKNSKFLRLAPVNGVAAGSGEAFRQAWKSRVQEADPAEGVMFSVAVAAGLAILAWRMACH
jgi:hypothetical protein